MPLDTIAQGLEIAIACALATKQDVLRAAGSLH
jgi:hypothetical protein